MERLAKHQRRQLEFEARQKEKRLNRERNELLCVMFGFAFLMTFIVFGAA